jgi:hypothetical protein
MLASIKDRLKRAEICHACEYYRRATRQCKQCGCIVNFKVMLSDTRCPLDKWLEVKPGTDVITQLQQRVWLAAEKDSSQDQK